MWEFLRTREKCGEARAERESFSHFLKFFISLTDAQQHGIYLLNLCEFVVHESSLYTKLTYMQLWKVRYIILAPNYRHHPVPSFCDLFQVQCRIIFAYFLSTRHQSYKAKSMGQNWQATPQWVSPATI